MSVNNDMHLLSNVNRNTWECAIEMEFVRSSIQIGVILMEGIKGNKSIIGLRLSSLRQGGVVTEVHN